MKQEFQSVCEALATKHTGFSLWLGAGVARAATGGKTPGWGKLVEELLAESSGNGSSAAAARNEQADFPDRLEGLSEAIGHRRFRRALREQLVQPVRRENMDLEVIEEMAIVGARASAIVSFNLEEATAIPFTFTRGMGASCMRVFTERVSYRANVERAPSPGPVSLPVYFPHGLLSHGRVVLTRSEYDELQAGIAMTTAVHVALGSDLVILGMSLDDAYLRSVLMHHRRWLGEIFWIDESFKHEEWARVAHVTMVSAPHREIWRGLANSFVTHDASGDFAKIRQKAKEKFEKALLD